MGHKKSKDNNLAIQYPELAAQWHPQKNGDITPSDVTTGSKKMVWWIQPYDDPRTGRHFVFEWPATVKSRTAGAGCPFLAPNPAIWPGFNDLATKRPDLASEWHPVKNGELRPDAVLPGSTQKVWWIYPYDDPATGQHYDFEWEAQINNRVNGAKCPFLCGQAVWPGYNDLRTTNPELAAQWHPTRNGELRPEDVSSKSHQTVWWLQPYDDPKTEQHFEFEWSSTVYSRTSGRGCPYLAGKKVWPGYNDLATRFPELAEQWHPVKNNDLRPEDVTIQSHQKVWWIQAYDDPRTGKHFDFEWEATVYNRASGAVCPFLTGNDVWIGFNDLLSTNPELALQWHPVKNGTLSAQDVTAGSKKKVWWILPYTDPHSGDHFDFEWEATINDRANGEGCPYLSNNKLWKGYNDLKTRFPTIAAEWHPIKNGEQTAENSIFCSTKTAWWLLPYDDPKTGLHYDFEWQAAVYSRTVNGAGCPYLSNDKVWAGYNDLESCYPAIAAEWHPIRNRMRLPSKVYKYSPRKAWWQCSRCGHEWYASIKGRTRDETGCPACRKQRQTYL